MEHNLQHNCGFTEEKRWFRYRAAAIVVEDGYVLFAGNEKEDCCYEGISAIRAHGNRAYRNR